MLEAPLLENSIKYVSIEDPTIDESIRKAMIIGQHMRDGRYAEWLGMRIIADADQRYEWEVRGYNAEISQAGAGTSGKACGICFAAIHKLRDSRIIEAIKTCKNDNDLIYAFRVSDFAVASLDVLGVEKYVGDNPQILELVESNFTFLDDLL